MTGDIVYEWRGELADEEMLDLIQSHGGQGVAGWWEQIRGHSLGWVTGRTDTGLLAGFVNVAWDGCDHAFLLDTKTRGDFQRRGIGSALVRVAATHAKAAGCEWLHVDFRPNVGAFYIEACGFEPTDAGLIHLHSMRPSSRD